MCHQTVGLVAAELERQGVATSSITMLPEITRRIRVPRALEVPFPLGYPLGAPNDPALQRAVLEAMLALTDRADTPLVAAFNEVAAPRTRRFAPRG